jgi:hypothetical protein
MYCIVFDITELESSTTCVIFLGFYVTVTLKYVTWNTGKEGANRF